MSSDHVGERRSKDEDGRRGAARATSTARDDGSEPELIAARAEIRAMRRRIDEERLELRQARASLEAARGDLESEYHAKLSQVDSGLRRAWDFRLTEIERAYRAEMTEAVEALRAAERARAIMEETLKAADAERGPLSPELQDARRLTAEAELALVEVRTLRARLGDVEKAARESVARNAYLQDALDDLQARAAVLGADLRMAREQSADLARELTASIFDRDRLKRYSLAELQLAVLRRLWPFR